MALPRFAEGFFPSAFAQKTSENTAANDAIFEFVPVTLEDLRRRGIWKNARGERMRINADTLTADDYTGSGDTYFDSLESVQKALTEGQYVFVPASIQAEQSGADTEPERSNQELNQQDARAALAALRANIPEATSDTVPIEIVAASRKGLRSKEQGDQREKGGRRARPEETVLGSGDGGDGTGLDGILAQSAALETVLHTLQSRLGEDESGSIKIIVEAIVEGKRQLDGEIEAQKDQPHTLRKKLPELEALLSSLAEKAQKALSSLDALAKEEAAPTVEEPTLEDILQETRETASKDIEAIDSPNAYGVFCATKMFELTGADGSPVRRVVNARKLEKALGRKLTREEFNNSMLNLENELKDKLIQKFRELKRQDLSSQTRQWRTQLKEAQAEHTLEALLETWSTEDPVSDSWRPVMADLSPIDQRVIAEDYTRRFEQFQGELVLALFLEQGGERAQKEAEAYKDIIEKARTFFESKLEKGKEKWAPDQLAAFERSWNTSVLPNMTERLGKELQTVFGIADERVSGVIRGILIQLDQEWKKNKKQ